MEPTTAGLISILLLLVFLAMGMPVAFAMGIPGLLGVWLVSGFDVGLFVLEAIPWESITRYTFSVVPLFIIMGNLVFHSGFGEALYRMLSAWIGHIRGGLAMSTVAACAIFGTCCGSGMATSVTVGKVAIPQMDKYGYERQLSLGSVASAGPLAAMIPPSVLMCYYGMLTQQSIAKLLMAGFIPGFMMALMFMVMIYIRVSMHPAMAPTSAKAPWSTRFLELRTVVPILIIAMVVFVGIYTGIFVPTEAGALGAFGALVVGLSYKRLNWLKLWNTVMDSMRTFGMIIAIVIGALIFNAALALSGVSTLFCEYIVTLPIHPIGVLVTILLFYVILGFFMDTVAILFLTLPTLFPPLMELGIDPILLGILLVLVCETGMITPPFGLALFATKGAVPGVKVSEVSRGIWWFLVCYLVALVLLLVFPQIALFIPNLMKL